jgi:hypothetical protein
MDIADLLPLEYPYFTLVVRYIQRYLLISNFLSAQTYNLRYMVHTSNNFYTTDVYRPNSH